MDYLIEDYDALEITREDRLSVLHARDGRAVQTLMKLCTGKALEARGQVMDSPSPMSAEEYESRIGAYRAYRFVLQFIAGLEDEQEEEVTDE